MTTRTLTSATGETPVDPSIAPAAGSPRTGRAVLVVDDDPDILFLVQSKLGREGCHVSVAADGLTAVELALASPPDLVLVDWMMPGMDGLQVCQALRGHGLRIPILLLTAKATREDYAAAAAADITDYITKPFSPRDLAQRVATHLAHAGTVTGAEPGPPVVGTDRGFSAVA